MDRTGNFLWSVRSSRTHPTPRPCPRSRGSGIISDPLMRSGGTPPKKPSPVPRPCPNTIPAPFGHWLMPVNVFRSLWKWPGFRRLSRKIPFRNSVYESPPVLHEIDPAHPPDWQSGPDMGLDIFRRDTVRGVPRKSPYRFPPCPNTIPAPFGHWLMPVNVFQSLWKQP